MKEHIYSNIWNYCEKKVPAPKRLYKVLRGLLFVFAIYYLLMCFAYLFAMLLAFRSEDVNFVSSGQAVNLFIVMLLSLAAAVAGWVCSLRRAYRSGVLLSAGTALLSPFALWNTSINTVFKVHHLIAMLLLLAVQTVLWLTAQSRRKNIRRKYDQAVANALAAYRKEGTLLSREETEQILQNFNPELSQIQKPLKRSQKDRLRKQK